MDREDRSKNDLNEITREAENAGVLLKVLPRKMLENSFIDAEAISAVLSNDEQKIGKDAVENWISTHGEDKGYFQKGRVPSLDTPKWLEDIDGAKFLKDMFGDLTNQTQRFDKRKHGKKIFDWLIINKPSFLEEL